MSICRSLCSSDRRRADACRRSFAIGGQKLSLRQTNKILLEEVERHGEQDDVLHQERYVTGHRREAAGRDVPTLRHERYDGDRGDERTGGAECPESTETLVPK